MDQWLGYAEQSPVMQELRRLKAEGMLTPEQALWMADYKPAEELYDLENDPDEVNNLAGSKEPTEMIIGMRGRLHKEMVSLRDLGLISEDTFTRIAEHGPVQAELDKVFELPFKPPMKYEGLLATAENASLPRSAWREPDIDQVMNWVFALPNSPVTQTASAWSQHALMRFVSPGERNVEHDRRALEELKETGYLPGAYPFKLAGAEANLRSRAPTAAVTTIADIMLDQEAGFARVEAAGILDLVPDMESYAEQLVPVAKQLREELGTQKTNQTAEDYLRRCLDRLEQRLGVKSPMPKSQ